MLIYTLTVGRYLKQLEARVKGYEKGHEKGHEKGAGCQGSLNVAPPEYQHQQDPPVTALSDCSTSPTAILDEDDIDDNPLTEKIAHLVLSPEGDKRSYSILFTTSRSRILTSNNRVFWQFFIR